MERIGVGWNEASRFGFEFRNVGWKAKGERNETEGWHERNEMKKAILRGLPRLELIMNGMERKVAERSAALECNGEKRKPPGAGFGRKIIHGLHLRRVVGLLVVYTSNNVD